MGPTEQVAWLHISDLHLKAELSGWEENTVLRDLVEAVRPLACKRPAPQFVVVSGDLAFAGRHREYELVTGFLDGISLALDLPRSRVYCVPGNHDVDRAVQTTCHLGARKLLTSHQAVEEFVTNEAERKTLLARQTNFRAFCCDYWGADGPTWTPEGLGFVANLEVGGLRVSIVGLNSAWLASGGDEDEHHLLVGERQVIACLDILRAYSPCLTLAVVHHPPDWLLRFDRTTLEDRLAAECDFLHRGHLHEPELGTVSFLSGSRCVVVGAGAAYVTRDFRNSFCVARADLSSETCEVGTFAYNPANGQYDELMPKRVPFRLRGAFPGSLRELVTALSRLDTVTLRFPNYLAALLAGRTDEVPVTAQGRVVFVSAARVEDVTGAATPPEVRAFLAVRNLVRAYAPEVPLEDRIHALSDRALGFDQYVGALADASAEMTAHVQEREAQYRHLAGPSVPEAIGHTIAFMQRLADEGDWPLLEESARRHRSDTRPEVALHASRMLALSLARTEDLAKREEAAHISAELCASPNALAKDFLMASATLHGLGRSNEAKQMILEALGRFPDHRSDILGVGGRLALDTGDRAFREELDDWSRQIDE